MTTSETTVEIDGNLEWSDTQPVHTDDLYLLANRQRLKWILVVCSISVIGGVTLLLLMISGGVTLGPALLACAVVGIVLYGFHQGFAAAREAHYLSTVVKNLRRDKQEYRAALHLMGSSVTAKQLSVVAEHYDALCEEQAKLLFKKSREPKQKLEEDDQKTLEYLTAQITHRERLIWWAIAAVRKTTNRSLFDECTTINEIAHIHRKTEAAA